MYLNYSMKDIFLSVKKVSNRIKLQKILIYKNQDSIADLWLVTKMAAFKASHFKKCTFKSK